MKLINIKSQAFLVVSKRQQGAALITALVFMGILTLLGISAMRSNTLDIKIHNAMMDRLNAFQCAEAALRQGEIYIKEISQQAIEVDALPIKEDSQVWKKEATNLNNLVNEDDNWWNTNGWSDDALADPNINIGCKNNADYIVQSLGGAGDGSDDLSFKKQAESQMTAYRISSRSEGVSDKPAVILQSTFTRQFH